MIISIFSKTLLVFICLQGISSYQLNHMELAEVSKEFIHVHGMKMDQHNYWWYPITLKECAEKCLEEKRIVCKSFSFCEERESCSTFELDRMTGPEYYNPPGHRLDPNGQFMWDYFELKSDKFRSLESKIETLQNLTEISIDDATEVLTNIIGIVLPNQTDQPHGNHSGAQPSELEIAGKSLMMVMDLNPIQNVSLEVAKNFADMVVNLSSSLIEPSNAASWKAAQKDPSSPGSSAIVTSSEQLTEQVSGKLLAAQNATQRILAEASEIVIWLDKAQFFENNNENNLSAYVFPNAHDHSTFPDSASSESQEPLDNLEKSFFRDVIILPRAALRNKSVVSNVRYKNLREAMPTRCSNCSKIPFGAKLRKNLMNSNVLTTSIYPRPPQKIFKNEPVTIIFKHGREPKLNNDNLSISNNETSNTLSQKTSEETMFCVYWEKEESNVKGGTWSTNGCFLIEYNQTHTICNCTHMTSFAVLLQIVDFNVDDETSRFHQKVLGVISKIGCALSLFGVTVMCAAFIKLKFHTENMKIHFNLGLAVGLANLTFLFEEIAEKSKPGCVLVTVLLFYFNMAVLAWMLVEGMHLYSQVVIVFVSIRRRFKYYVVVGWGTPLFILIISMGILNVQLGHNKTCWLSPEDNSIWAFAAPAILVIVTNIIILISVVRIIVRINPGKSNDSKISKLRNALKGCVFLFPLLGTTWIFGFLSLSKETIAFQYIFAISNSLQGFFLFIFHCVCNSEVREDARRHKWFRSVESRFLSSSQNPPFHSHHLFSFNITSGIRRFRNSISFEFPSSHSTGIEEHGDKDDKNKKRTRKLSLILPRMFSVKLPNTIAEKEEKYEESNGNSTSSCDFPHGVVEAPKKKEIEKTIPLPGMPTKNDTIKLDQFRKSSTNCDKFTTGSVDRIFVDEMIHKALREMFKDIDPTEEELIKKTIFCDCIKEEEEDDKEKKIKMSYDSGLNSIDNESILEEDDETWMAGHQEKHEIELAHVTPKKTMEAMK